MSAGQQHTAGEWALADGKVIMGKRHDGDSIAVGIALGIIEYGDQRDRDTAAANANLMAAAPAMLEALRAIVMMHDAHRPLPIPLARAAITRATT